MTVIIEQIHPAIKRDDTHPFGAAIPPKDIETLATAVFDDVSERAAVLLVENAPYSAKLEAARTLPTLTAIRVDGEITAALANARAALSLSSEAIDRLGLDSPDGKEVLLKTIQSLTTADKDLAEAQLIKIFFGGDQAEGEQNLVNRRRIQIFFDPSQVNQQRAEVGELYYHLSKNPQEAYRTAKVLEGSSVIAPMTDRNSELGNLIKGLSTEEFVLLYIEALRAGALGDTQIPTPDSLIVALSNNPTLRDSLEAHCARLIHEEMRHDPSLITSIHRAASGRPQNDDWLPSQIRVTEQVVSKDLADLNKEVTGAAKEEIKGQVTSVDTSKNGDGLYFGVEQVLNPESAGYVAPTHQNVSEEQSENSAKDKKEQVSVEAAKKEHKETLFFATQWFPDACANFDLVSIVRELKGVVETLCFIVGEARKVEEAEVQREEKKESENHFELILAKTEEAARLVIDLMPSAINSPVITSLLQRDYRDTTFPIIETRQRILDRLGPEDRAIAESPQLAYA